MARLNNKQAELKATVQDIFGYEATIAIKGDADFRMAEVSMTRAAMMELLKAAEMGYIGNGCDIHASKVREMMDAICELETP